MQPATASPTPFAQPFEPNPFVRLPEPEAFTGADESGPPTAGQPGMMEPRGEPATSADPREATFSGPGFQNTATGFEAVHGYAWGGDG